MANVPTFGANPQLPPGPLEPGERAPDFFLPDQRDIHISLYDKVKGGPIVIVFLPNRDAAGTRQAFIATAPKFAAAGAHLFLVCGGRPLELVSDAVAVGEAARLVADVDGMVARRYGVAGRRIAFVLDPNARVRAVFTDDEMIGDALDGARALAPASPVELTMHPPILLIPEALEPAFCTYLIGEFHRRGHQDSGTFRMEEGRMVKAPNYGVKRRQDHHVVDADLLEAISSRFRRRIAPEIQRAFNTRIAWVEEFKIVCYDAEPGGYFRPHRDNTTPQTAHRRLAMTLVLNAEEFEGGELRFPEYGNTQYRPGTGTAVIFSCSLLHEAKPITRGLRYVLLSFMSDEAGKAQYQRFLDASSTHPPTV
ncbi:MAG: redoxin domain-containing protein [Alphaproteobacteria bacterium]|nr:redoxin domain-containing protein [Alphaproteobacteria bacterium]